LQRGHVAAHRPQLALARGRPLFAELGQRLNRDVPVVLRDVRLATDDEIQMCRWQCELELQEDGLVAIGNGDKPRTTRGGTTMLM